MSDMDLSYQPCKDVANLISEFVGSYLFCVIRKEFEQIMQYYSKSWSYETMINREHEDPPYNIKFYPSHKKKYLSGAPMSTVGLLWIHAVCPEYYHKNPYLWLRRKITNE